MLEGDCAKEKCRAWKKDRPEGWGECAVLNRIREDCRQRLGREPALFLSQAEERSAKALRTAGTEWGSRRGYEDR